MIRINKTLSLFFVLLLSLGGLLVFITEKLSPLITHATYYCQSFINTHMIPIPYYFSVIPITLLFLTLLLSFIKLLVLTGKIQYLRYTLKDKITLDSRVNKVIQSLRLEEKAVVIKSQDKFAYCLGIRTSKIYISTGLISQLSLKEVEAVLRHEQYHLENHDTFTMIIASVAHSLFPFFPLLGDLIKKYKVEREIQADKFAVEKVGSSEPLIFALKKILALPMTNTVAMAAIADQDTLEPRIYSLINKQYTKRQFRLKHLFITLLSTFIVGFVIISPVRATEIHHEEHDVIMFCTDGKCMNSCTSESNLNKLYSEIPSNPKVDGTKSSQPYTSMH